MNTAKIAIFVDIENLTHWVTHNGPNNLLNELNTKGSVIVRKAYGNWSQSNISSLQAGLDCSGFDLIHNVPPLSGKSSADIQLTIDVIECAITRPDIDCFILATSDSDFSPLFRQLRGMGKTLIGVGPKSSLSKSVESSCSRYIFTEQDTHSNHLTRSRYNKASTLACNILRSLKGYAGCNELKKHMLAVDPTFDEKKHGFKSFLHFLEQISAVKLISIDGSMDVIAYIQIETEKKTVESASSTDQKMPILKQQLLENKESTVDMYQRFLHAHDWYLVVKHHLIRIYHFTATMEPMPRSDLEYQIANDLAHEMDISTVRRCIAIFVKSGLFDLSLQTDKEGNSQKLFSLERNVNYLKEIDFSLLSRLLQRIESKQQDTDQTVIKQMLYNKYTEDKLDQLIADARTNVSLLRG